VIVGFAFVPHPPVLLPGITGRPVAEVEELRAACLDAVRELVAFAPELILVVGGVRSDESDKPLSISVGRSLLHEASVNPPIEHVVVPMGGTRGDCREVGEAIAARPERIGLLVMGDGSACRTLKAPGYLDERAAPFDDQIESALRSADPMGLVDLDRSLAAELLVAGWAAWQVAAQAALTNGHGAGRLIHASDPFGVYYPVALWSAS